jgi:hypothetical protein
MNKDIINSDLAKAELELKQIELLIKRKEFERPAKKWKLTIELATIFVAIIAFIGSFLGTFYQGLFSREQQRKQFESTLIINAVETGNSDSSKKNLKFLLDVGLISDKAWKINLDRIILDTTYKINYSNPPDNPPGISDNANSYICSRHNAFAFHDNKNCQALTRCSDSVLFISVYEARYKYGRYPCKICY